MIRANAFFYIIAIIIISKHRLIYLITKIVFIRIAKYSSFLNQSFELQSLNQKFRILLISFFIFLWEKIKVISLPFNFYPSQFKCSNYFLLVEE